MADKEPESATQAISLDALTAAFAQAMGVPSPPRAEPAAEVAVPQDVVNETAAPAVHEELLVAVDDDACCPISPQSIFEAMLFVGNRDAEPLSAARAAELMRGVEADEVPAIVEQLNERYTAEGCPYEILSDERGYRLTLRKDYRSLRDRFLGRIREARLSQAAIDVLSIVAYRQSLGAEEVSKLRGKPSGHILTQLVHRGLLRIERRQAQGQRRTTHYFTTNRFLQLFGLDDLKDLPQSEEPG